MPKYPELAKALRDWWKAQGRWPSRSSFAESTGVGLATDKAVAPGPAGSAVANRGLRPSSLIDGATGNIDYTRSSWSRSSWSRSSWSTADGTTITTWTCACAGSGATVDGTRSSWSRSSWSGRLEP